MAPGSYTVGRHHPDERRPADDGPRSARRREDGGRARRSCVHGRVRNEGRRRRSGSRAGRSTCVSTRKRCRRSRRSRAANTSMPGTAADLKKVYEKLNARLVLERKETEITFLFAATRRRCCSSHRCSRCCGSTGSRERARAPRERRCLRRTTCRIRRRRSRTTTSSGATGRCVEAARARRRRPTRRLAGRARRRARRRARCIALGDAGEPQSAGAEALRSRRPPPRRGRVPSGVPRADGLPEAPRRIRRALGRAGAGRARQARRASS